MAQSLALVTIALAIAVAGGGCGGDDETPAALTLKERLLPTADAGEGFEVKEEFDWSTAHEAVLQGLGPGLPQQNEDEAETVLEQAGLVAGVGELLTKGDNENLIVIVLRFASSDGARKAGDWLHQQDRRPCRETCSTDISEFDVDQIPDASGVQRLVNERRAGPLEVLPPWDRYLIGFSDGQFLYQVERASPYATGTEGDEDEARDAAKALYDRVKGAPAPS